MIGRILPIAVFALLGVLLAIGLKIADKKEDLPSPLIDKPMPAFALPMLYEEQKIVDSGEMLGKPVLVNFWASWCVTCRVEHPVIERLAKAGLIGIVGIAFRDEPADSKAWLEHFGNPYTMVLMDRDGRTSIDFGVYAAPESFLVDTNGTIVYKQLGALTPEAVDTEILPRIGKKGSAWR